MTRAPDLTSSVFLAISQSGASPDLARRRDAARAQRGALIVALVNAEDSPLAQRADHVVPLRAGAERSVAATKSFIASLAAIMHLVSPGPGMRALRGAPQAPAHLERAWSWTGARLPRTLPPRPTCTSSAADMGLAMAQEAALKFKETCGLHAEAVSAAELRHGPMALVRPGFPVLIFSQNDESRAGIETACRGAWPRRAPMS